MKRRSDDVNWQQTGREFAVGDAVNMLDGIEADVGRVVAVWPAIGMLDLQFPTGWCRRPVEDVILVDKSTPYVPPTHSQVPGGVGTVPVSAGPPNKAASVRRVAEAYVKKALYWAARDRQYQPTQEEIDTGNFICPRCKGSMGMARYKRRNGISERLLACHGCLFLIKPMDAGLEG